MNLIISQFLLVAVASAFVNGAHQHCKPVPGDVRWPDPGAWRALNSSVSGRLSVPVPIGSVCHSGQSDYNKASCAIVATQWSNTTFQSLNPVSGDYNDETCLPNAETPCSASGYPAYVISAHNARDVQKGVKFAQRTGIRLIIKGTGHDAPGRSSGPDSLSIYTHNIRGLSIDRSDPKAAALGGIASIKIYAGEQMRNIYAFASKSNITIVGGADLDVGIGGWMSGGGHGPVSATYGMGADQVLEMEVVTADGRLRTINADSDSDLFWAMRGGGAGTFAVLVSVTMKAYPSVESSELYFSYSTAVSDLFWSFATYFHSQLPRLAESGISGYYYMVPNNQAQTNASIQATISGIWIGLGLTPEQMATITKPMETYMQAASWAHPIYSSSTPVPPSDFMTWWLKNNPVATAGINLRLGSRLLGNSSLLGDSDLLEDALRTSTPAPAELLGHLVGPVANSQRPTGGIAGGSNAVLPAWRDSYVHAVLPRTWALLNESEKSKVTTDLRDVRVKALRDLSPNTGAYMSESDPTEPDWQAAKYGKNYGRLLEIKQKWDPTGVFWCKQCVGSELWDAEGPMGVENGVGQNKVRLCRKGGAGNHACHDGQDL